MRLAKYTTAIAELLLISPALMFMSALFVRNLQPQQYEPARTAQRIVMLYAHSVPIGLWVCLMALPLFVLVSGAATLAWRWTHEPELRRAMRTMAATINGHVGTLLIVGATLAASGVLGIVALHVATD